MRKLLSILVGIFALSFAQTAWAVDATVCLHKWSTHVVGIDFGIGAGDENLSYWWQCTGDYSGDVGDRAAESRDITVFEPAPGAQWTYKQLEFEVQSSDACGHSWYITKADGTCVGGDCGNGEWSFNNKVQTFDSHSGTNADRSVLIYSGFRAANPNDSYFYIRFKHSGLFCSTHHSWMKVNVKAPGTQANGTIVFLHGFAGFGPNEVGNHNKYWGWMYDPNDSDHHYRNLVDGMRRRGMDARAAAVGPVSSNHDRACELFAQLTNADTVYYGNAHVAQFGHLATVAALSTNFKQDPTGWANVSYPVHVIAHSQGGQTVRRLVQIINANQCAGEDPNSAFCYKSTHPAGASALIASITTISTPHNGTTLTWGVDHLLYSVFKQHADEIYDDVVGLDSSDLSNDGFAWTNGLYNLKLDQWANVPTTTLNGSLDMSFYDLSPLGATAQNASDSEDPNIYYFSWVTARGNSDTGSFCGMTNTSGSSSILGCLANFAIAPGEWTCPAQWTTDNAGSLWAFHDGVVNVWSQPGPRSGRHPSINYFNCVNLANYTISKGIWNSLGYINEDHMSVIGVGCPEKGIMDGYMSGRGEPDVSTSKTANPTSNSDWGLRITDWYEDHCNFLRSLN